ncbi:MAG: outer membrane beta-barrel protein [Vicinamibacteria bacterium]
MNALERRSLVATFLVVACLAAGSANASDETVRLLNMFARSDADIFEVHIVANGDISGFKTTRRAGPESYRLTIDVPALSPVDTKYDVATPFTRSFEMWPMKLGDEVYSRIILELDLQASSVVSQHRPTQILIKISRNSPPANAEGSIGEAPETATATEAVAALPDGGVPADAGEVPARSGDVTAAEPPVAALEPEPAVASAPHAEDEAENQVEFISLFPAPNEGRPMFEPPMEQVDAAQGPTNGILLGRFLFQPLAEFSWVRGDNVTLDADDPFSDDAIYARAVADFKLIDSENTLDFAYQLRYRNFKEFDLLKENFSHGFDVRTNVPVSPRMQFDARNHFLHGTFETTEFDPGQEVFFNVEPFNHNLTEVGLTMDLNERLGVALHGGYDFVRFQDEQTVFFDYETIRTGGSFYYRRSPVSSIFGEYVRDITPEPATRPESKSTANSVQAGIQGELTPLLTGTVRAGYSWQEFGSGASALEYRGFVASASITRYFSEAASILIEAGRQTNLSNFEDNSYYVTNFGTAQFTGPLRRNLQLVTGGSLYDNRYPLETIEATEPRNDQALAGWVGAAYFFSPLTYFRADYRYERRRSNLDQFQYTNNVLRVIVGVGIFSR